MDSADKTYTAALETYRAASRAFELVTKQHRLRDIGDAEFLAARAAFAGAQADLDLAEVAYMRATGSDLSVLP